MLKLILFVLGSIAVLLYRAYKASSKVYSKNYVLGQHSGFEFPGKKIKVDLSEVQVKSNVWTREVVLDSPRYGGLNQMIGQGDKNIEKVKQNWNVVLYEAQIEGQKLMVEERVIMEPKTLQMKLMMKGETFLYYDPSDLSQSYLDLRFLIEED